MYTMGYGKPRSTWVFSNDSMWPDTQPDKDKARGQVLSRRAVGLVVDDYDRDAMASPRRQRQGGFLTLGLTASRLSSSSASTVHSLFFFPASPVFAPPPRPPLPFPVLLMNTWRPYCSSLPTCASLTSIFVSQTSTPSCGYGVGLGCRVGEIGFERKGHMTLTWKCSSAFIMR